MNKEMRIENLRFPAFVMAAGFLPDSGDGEIQCMFSFPYAFSLEKEIRCKRIRAVWTRKREPALEMEVRVFSIFGVGFGCGPVLGCRIVIQFV